jgi:hypothetical protein
MHHIMIHINLIDKTLNFSFIFFLIIAYPDPSQSMGVSLYEFKVFSIQVGKNFSMLSLILVLIIIILL